MTQELDKDTEKKHISKVLKINGYPNWIIKKQQNRHENTNRDKSPENRSKGLAVIPYIKGLSECIRAVLQQNNIATAFKPHITLRKLLEHPKDKTSNLDKTGVVYHITCAQCPSDYIGETSRKTKQRILEHRRPSCTEISAMAHHVVYNKHKLDISSVKILD